jgi:hypothetical protein
VQDVSTLKHTTVDEATALSMMGEAADPEHHKHHKHHKHKTPCGGQCQAGVCVVSHHTKHCCHSAETEEHDAADAEKRHRHWHCWN